MRKIIKHDWEKRVPFDFSSASKDIKELMMISPDAYPGEISYFVENEAKIPLKGSLSIAKSNVSQFYRFNQVS